MASILYSLWLSQESGIAFDDYNNVDPRFFTYLWQSRRYAYSNLGPQDILKRNTEQFYAAFLQNWRIGIRHGSFAPCLYDGYFTCPDDIPVIFERNGVGLSLLHMDCIY